MSDHLTPVYRVEHYMVIQISPCLINENTQDFQLKCSEKNKSQRIHEISTVYLFLHYILLFRNGISCITYL